jgi:tetratricopeptide (TPR) repeat protein
VSILVALWIFSLNRKCGRRPPDSFIARAQLATRAFAIAFISLQIVLTTHVVSGQPRISNRSLANSYFSSARKALAAGDSVTALEQLRRAVHADSTFAEAYLLLGLTEFQRGETEDSIVHYKRALQLQPRSFSGHYNLALAYLRQHKFQQARTHLERAVALDARQADAVYDLGIVLLELGAPSLALTNLRNARTLDPLRSDVAFNIVRAELETGRTVAARMEADASAKRLISDFQWNIAIGELFLKAGMPRDAAVYLHQASLLRPDDAESRRQLAAAYLQSHESDKVLDTITVPTSADDHYLRASAYYTAGRFTDADLESNLALELSPENPQVLVLRARLLQRAGLQDAALQMTRKAITLAPNWDEPYYLAGVSSYFIRRYDEASKNLARARELNPNSARTFFLEAIALASQGKIQDAEQQLRHALALEPNNARFYAHLGILLGRRNEYSQAEVLLRKAIQIKPDYALSHYELGKLLITSKRLREAAQELEQAVRYDPAMGAPYYQLARVYQRLGETEKSTHFLAEFERLHQQESKDSEAVDRAQDDEDTRKEVDSP